MSWLFRISKVDPDIGSSSRCSKRYTSLTDFFSPIGAFQEPVGATRACQDTTFGPSLQTHRPAIFELQSSLCFFRTSSEMAPHLPNPQTLFDHGEQEEEGKVFKRKATSKEADTFREAS